MIFILKIFCILPVFFAVTEAEFLNVTYASNALCSEFGCSGYNLFENTRFADGDPFVPIAMEFSPCNNPLALHTLHLDSSDPRLRKLLKIHEQNEETIALVTPGDKGKECYSGFQNAVLGNATRSGLCDDDAGDEVSFARLIVGWNAAQKPARYSVALEVNFTHIFQHAEFLPIASVPLRYYRVLNCQYGSSLDASVVLRKKKEFNRREGFDVVTTTLLACCHLYQLIKKWREPPVDETAETDGGRRLDDLEEESEDSEEEDSIPSSRDSSGDQRNIIKL